MCFSGPAHLQKPFGESQLYPAFTLTHSSCVPNQEKPSFALSSWIAYGSGELQVYFQKEQFTQNQLRKSLFLSTNPLPQEMCPIPGMNSLYSVHQHYQQCIPGLWAQFLLGSSSRGQGDVPQKCWVLLSGLQHHLLPAVLPGREPRSEIPASFTISICVSLLCSSRGRNKFAA